MLKKFLSGAAASAAAIGLSTGIGFADEEDGMDLIQQARDTLAQCELVADSCGDVVAGAAGVLVFPEVLRADLIVGGAGGNGVLLVDGEPTHFFDIGRGSVGLQAGIDEAAMVFAFKELDTLMNLRDGDEWELGVETGLTVIEANADANATSGDPVVYVFDADGLNAEFNVNVLRIWHDRENAY